VIHVFWLLPAVLALGVLSACCSAAARLQAFADAPLVARLARCR
jgi:hypothetical protein